MEKKNYGKSVRTRLVNLMNETGYKYMYHKMERRYTFLHCHANHQRPSSTYGHEILGKVMIFCEAAFVFSRDTSHINHILSFQDTGILILVAHLEFNIRFVLAK